MALDHVAALESQTRIFGDLLADGDLSTPVPTCPGWTLADLGEHLRFIHRWAAHAITEGNPDGATDPVEDVVAGYRGAAAALVELLRSTAPDAEAWTFGPAPKAAAFWQRRQLHETAVHLYDALGALGRESDWSLSPDLAWDGVDEVASLFYPRQVRLGRTEPLPGSMRLIATDVQQELVLGDGAELGVLEGTAGAVLLMLWRRLPVPDSVALSLEGCAVTP